MLLIRQRPLFTVSVKNSEIFATLAEMKRLLLHILFWTIYTLQDTLLMFTWAGPGLANIPDSVLFVMALKSAFVVLMPKLIATYYLLYVSIDKLTREKGNQVLIVGEILVVLCACVGIYRAIFNYIVIPDIYDGKLQARKLIDVRSFLFALMDIGFVSGVAVAIKFVRMQLKGKEREKSLVKDKLETELKFLRNQTKPHFLLNTLNNIFALARKKSDETPEAIMKLSELLRFMLYESRESLVTLASEIKILDDYLSLETMRYSERLSVKFRKHVDSDKYQIAPLLLLPFVENAFKHGVSESRFDSFVHINLEVLNNNLKFQVENTSENEIAMMPGNNIGLNNVKRQLELMYRDHELTVNKDNHIFKVFLTINLDSYVKI
jgi:two-component system, LytTR family, sensor kinase